MGELDLDDLDALLRDLGVDLDSEDHDDLHGSIDPPQGRHVDEPTSAQRCDEPELVARLESDDVLTEWGLDPAVDLPSPTPPPGYFLDARTVLRYVHDSTPVPGQLRVTLERRWRFPRDSGRVLVPAVWARSRPELAWVDRVAPELSSVQLRATFTAAHPVPAELWDAMARHCFAVTAPELAPSELLTPAEVAELAGLSPSSVATFLARGALPPPTARVGSTPLWSAPVLGVWLANRRGPGRPRTRGRRSRS